MRRRPALVGLLFLAGCGGDEAPRAAADPLVESLRQGGLTLVLRHGPADAEIARQEKLSSCALQRNLTVRGKDLMREAGRAIRALRIPIGDVRASPLCRARDTAQLAFGRVTTDRDLISPGVIGTEADDRRRVERLRARAEQPPPPGENVVLVTHTGNIGGAFGEATVQEGETLVLGEGARVVGRVTAERWVQLAAGCSSPPGTRGGSCG